MFRFLYLCKNSVKLLLFSLLKMGVLQCYSTLQLCVKGKKLGWGSLMSTTVCVKRVCWQTSMQVPGSDVLITCYVCTCFPLNSSRKFLHRRQRGPGVLCTPPHETWTRNDCHCHVMPLLHQCACKTSH